MGLTLHGSSFKDWHFGQSETLAAHAKELLKLKNRINILPYYPYLLNMYECSIILYLSIELQLTGKSFTFPFKDTSLVSVALNSLYALPRQNWVGKITFFLPVLN